MNKILLANPGLTSFSEAMPWCLERSLPCAPPERIVQINFSAESTESRREFPKSRKAIAPSRQVCLYHPRSSVMPWVSSRPTGSKAKVFLKLWTFCLSRLLAKILPSTRPTWPIPLQSLTTKLAGTRILEMYGNICYDTRDHYVNFPWSSEQK